MIIYSFKFIICFFVFFWVYWLLGKNKSIQNGLLLIISYVFYGLWDWRCLPLLFFISIIAYGVGAFFVRVREDKIIFKKKSSRWWVSFGAIICCLLVLGYFKYTNFFLQSISNISGNDFEPLNIILPVGISFYTFSAISYIVDCYRRTIEPTKDLTSILLYTSFFPALLSGPIHSAQKQLPQYFVKRIFNYDLVVSGFKDYVWGAFLKLCIADRLGMYVDAVYGNLNSHSGTTLLLTAILYSFQIYSDFAGYSLMAIGCGKMLGINLQNNFNLPYFAKSITDFWSRWHMSLTGWFKCYVYIPLGGNRVNKFRWIINILIVFLLSGLWHGAAYSFLIWGGLHGIVQVIEKIVYGNKIKQLNDGFSIINIFRMLLTFSIVSIAWIFFRLSDVRDAFTVVGKIFTNYGPLFIEPTLLLAFFSLGIMFIKETLECFGKNNLLFNSKYTIVRLLSLAFVICYILLMGVLEGGQFIYFQF